MHLICALTREQYRGEISRWMPTDRSGSRAIPLRHNLIGIGQVASDVLHLSWVGVTDLVVGPPVVGTFNHDDVGARTAELNGVALAGQLPADHGHGDRGAAESWAGETTSQGHTHRLLGRRGVCRLG